MLITFNKNNTPVSVRENESRNSKRKKKTFLLSLIFFFLFLPFCFGSSVEKFFTESSNTNVSNRF